MKKIIAAFTTGILIVSVAVTTASAEEHEVQKGENLWNIANEYNTTVEELTEINSLKTTTIQPKQVIYINETYVVQRGDTLIDISEEYDITVDDLKEWNNLKADLIVIGQELQIRGTNVNQEEVELPEETEEVVTTNTSNKAEKAEAKTTTAEQSSEGKTISVSATAYTAGCDGCSGVTYTGVDLNKDPNAKVIAVDPKVIPLGSEVYVEDYGYAIAADIGSAIKGNKIDLHVPTKDEAFAWGVRTVDVTVVK